MPRVAALLETLLSMLQMLILLLLEKKRRRPPTIPGESAEGTAPQLLSESSVKLSLHWAPIIQPLA